MVKYIVIVKNGTIENPKTQKDFDWLEKNKDNHKEVFKKFGKDIYVAKQKKDTEEFMTMSADVSKAQIFGTKEQAMFIAHYLDNVNKQNKKDFKIVVGTIKHEVKEVKDEN